jgi:hypothetical protein
MLSLGEAASPARGPAVASRERRQNGRRPSFSSGLLLPLVPKHRERQFMQRLRGRGWVKAIEIPEGGITLQRLLEKRWVESQGSGMDVSYRITNEGMAAKTAAVPLRRRRVD